MKCIFQNIFVILELAHIVWVFNRWEQNIYFVPHPVGEDILFLCGRCRAWGVTQLVPCDNSRMLCSIHFKFGVWITHGQRVIPFKTWHQLLVLGFDLLLLCHVIHCRTSCSGYVILECHGWQTSYRDHAGQYSWSTSSFISLATDKNGKSQPE